MKKEALQPPPKARFFDPSLGMYDEAAQRDAAQKPAATTFSAKARTFVKRHHHLLKLCRVLTRRNKRERLLRLEDQVIWTKKWTNQLPNIFDAVIGIPRAGLIIADTIALRFTLPLSTPSSFMRGEWFYTQDLALPDIKHVLLVDDFIDNGRQLMAAAKAMRMKYPNIKFSTASLIVTEHGAEVVDYYFHRTVEREERLFTEWDLTQFKGDARVAADMDGILCEDPPAAALKSDEAYRGWLRVARPHLIPKFKLNAIVTARPRRFRQETEDWLQTHGVAYDALVMSPLTRHCTLQESVDLKVEAARKINPTVFWESDWAQAKLIRNRLSLPVICIDKMMLLT